MNNFDIF